MRQAAKYVKMEERARKQAGTEGKKRRKEKQEGRKEKGMEGQKREREGPIIIKMAFQ